ncbi:MAG: SpoIID/LytB domain-containing protein [Leptolyngbyaceae cyanobacterium RU_5_1]|nr:SpoIID/LytB domain-containing protein [Leptolyngbyaceae cyanobacterium RU_5_1]
MNRQAVITWLQQRPWLLIPFLGVIPIVGLSNVHQDTPPLNSENAPPTPVMPTAAVTLPPLAAVSPSPQTLLSKQPSPASPTPTPIPQKQPVTPPRNTNPQTLQAAIGLSVDSAIQMRVVVQKGVESLPIGTSAGGIVLDAQTGKRLHNLPAQSVYEAQADGKTILLGALRLPSAILIDPIPNGVTYVGDRAYRGRMLLVGSDSRLWAVNHVSLQQYLYSVVGSEVSPSWPMEALKAQAVAARSYALTYHLKPVKRELWDMGDDEYYQVYKGIESEATTTRQAVNVTGGEFVSYRGGVVESLYAATDDIVMEAFQGKGMSQIGALGLAEKGYTYRQILGNYYSGTAVGRIEMDME